MPGRPRSSGEWVPTARGRVLPEGESGSQGPADGEEGAAGAQAGADAWDGARVAALRRRLGLSQADFARALGVRQQTVSEWETGRYRPRGASARVLAFCEERAPYDEPARDGP